MLVCIFEEYVDLLQDWKNANSTGPKWKKEDSSNSMDIIFFSPK